MGKGYRPHVDIVHCEITRSAHLEPWCVTEKYDVIQGSDECHAFSISPGLKVKKMARRKT
jgi:hypothetical protein